MPSDASFKKRVQALAWQHTAEDRTTVGLFGRLKRIAVGRAGLKV
ncbi:MAG: hypothetical protein V3T84_01545 [Phycisphaerales bacterium]